MSILEANEICDQLRRLMTSKVKVEVCEKNTGRTCAKHLEREITDLPGFQVELNRLWKQLIPIYRADPKNVRIVLIRHVNNVIGCLDALENLGGKFIAKQKKPACGGNFWELNHELGKIFRKHKREVCDYIFCENPEAMFQAGLSPNLAVQKLSKVQVILVELGDLPSDKKKSVKQRFEWLLKSGFFQFRSIESKPKMKQLKKASKIIGCTIRYLQDLESEMKDSGQNPWSGNPPSDPRDELFDDLGEN